MQIFKKIGYDLSEGDKVVSNALQIYKRLHWIFTVRFHTKPFSNTELIYNYPTLE